MDDRRAAMLNEMLAVTADAIARVVENLKAIEQALRLLQEEPPAEEPPAEEPEPPLEEAQEPSMPPARPLWGDPDATGR